MNDHLAMLLDASSQTEWEIAVFTTFGVLVAGIAAIWLTRRWSREDVEAQKERKALDEAAARDRAALEAELVGLTKQLSDEAKERRLADDKECDLRREKDDALGRDISSLRETLAYYFGKAGKDRPNFRGS